MIALIEQQPILPVHIVGGVLCCIAAVLTLLSAFRPRMRAGLWVNPRLLDNAPGRIAVSVWAMLTGVVALGEGFRSPLISAHVNALLIISFGALLFGLLYGYIRTKRTRSGC